VHGQVAGSWRVEAGRIVIDPFTRLPANTREAVEQEAAYVEELYKKA
jgi:hypothetical protein